MLGFLLVEPVTRASTLYRVYTTFWLVKQQIFKTILKQKATQNKEKLFPSGSFKHRGSEIHPLQFVVKQAIGKKRRKKTFA